MLWTAGFPRTLFVMMPWMPGFGALFCNTDAVDGVRGTFCYISFSPAGIRIIDG